MHMIIINLSVQEEWFPKVINAYLCGLGVLIDYRNRGIATEISNRLVDKCRNSNLHFQFFCDEKLEPLYKKMRFEKFAIGMKLIQPSKLEKHIKTS